MLAKDSAAAAQRLAFFDAAPEAVKQRELVAMRLIPLYTSAGRLPLAESLLRQMGPPVSPESVEWRRRTEAAIADAHLKAGRGAEAAAAMVRSTAPGEAGNSGDIPPKKCLELAASLERGKKHDEAMQWVERAADWPKNSTAVPKPTPSLDDLYNRAMALARVRRFPEAKADMEQVAAADRGGNLGHDAEMTLRHWKAAGVIQ